MRRPAARTKPRVARDTSFPTLVRGWIANEALSSPGPGGAVRLENFFPTATDVRMRAGTETFATIGSGDDPVTAMFSYVTGAGKQMFGATASEIYDVTTVADPAVSPAPEAGGPYTSGAWSTVQFQNSGGIFLRCVNGADEPVVYDGTSFTTSPAITGPADASKLSFVWSYKNRLFFIEKDTLDVWYLPVDAIGGAATKLPLGGVFPQGGTLVLGASWSLDSGSGGGLSEQCVFMTSEGEVAVYQGSNPGDANDWSKVNVYKIGRPLGPKAFIRGGSDLIIATDIGFIPLSQAIQRDVAALAPAAVSYPIETEWNARVAARSAAPWNCEVWPTRQMVITALPSVNGAPAEWLVANARTGAWCLYTGWDATCVEVFSERLFFGSVNGRIIEAEVGGLDVDASSGEPRTYTAVAIPLFDGLRSPASIKEAGTARAVIRAPSSAVGVVVSAHADFVIELPSAPDAPPQVAASVWGLGVWGTSRWGSPTMKQVVQDWESVSAIGFALTVAVQITSGNIAPPQIELVRIDLTYQRGDL